MHMLEGETEQSFVLADRERERKWMCVLVWPCRSALEWVYFTKRVWVYVSPLCIAQCVCLESERDRQIERESSKSNVKDKLSCHFHNPGVFVIPSFNLSFYGPRLLSLIISLSQSFLTEFLHEIVKTFKMKIFEAELSCAVVVDVAV